MLSKIWRRGLHSLPLGRLPLRPALTHSKDEEPANSPLRGSLCRRLRTSGSRRTRPAADVGPLLRGIQALRSDNQSRKDGCTPPTWTILPPPPPSPLTTNHLPKLNISNIWGATYPVMAPWTEKLTLESARQVRRWAVSAIECSANITSIYLRKWRSTMPWFFSPSSMVVRRGHCIAGISRNWSSSICELSAPSWESGGRTTSPIWRSSIKLSPPVQRPSSSRPNFDGLDTRSEWMCVGCSDAWCTGNQGRPKLQYKDTVKANLQWCHINLRDLEGYAMDRPKWRCSVHRATANFEEAWCLKLTADRETL